jgi:hypothetical protein
MPSVVFIHGLAKKPAPDDLKRIWLEALSRDNPRPDCFKPPNEGVRLGNLGAQQLFSYYADVFYGEDYEKDLSSYNELDSSAAEIASERLDQLELNLPFPRGVTPRERRFVRNLEIKMRANPAMVVPKKMPRPGKAAKVTVEGKTYEIAAWLPGPVKEAVIKKAAMEAYYYLFNKDYVRPKDGVTFKTREVIRKRLLDEIDKAKNAGPVVVVSHSMGTMVAYDVIRNCPECPPVDLLITLGSPLGITEVQDELIAEGEDEVDFPAERLKKWINIYDPLDPVCGADPRISNDFAARKGRKIVDVKESNWGSWRHTITHYLSGTLLRKHLREAIA